MDVISLEYWNTELVLRHSLRKNQNQNGILEWFGLVIVKKITTLCKTIPKQNHSKKTIPKKLSHVPAVYNFFKNNTIAI